MVAAENPCCSRTTKSHDAPHGWESRGDEVEVQIGVAGLRLGDAG